MTTYLQHTIHLHLILFMSNHGLKQTTVNCGKEYASQLATQGMK